LVDYGGNEHDLCGISAPKAAAAGPWPRDGGAILANDTLVNLVRGWPALSETTVAGIHFVQEDSPDEIGKAIVDSMGTLG
jgi:hypothetical protein